MKTLKQLYCILLMLVSVSCQKEEINGSAPNGAATTLTFTAPGMKAATRALTEQQEKALVDLNLWIKSRSLPETSRHFYVTSQNSISVTLPVGEYDYYCIGNVGKDMGDRTQDDLEVYRLAVTSESDLEQGGRMVMSAHGTFAAGSTSSVPVELIRCAAKIELSLKVSPDFMANVQVQSVQVMSVPGTIASFGENRSSEITAFIDYAPRTVTGNTFTGTFYVPENLAGVNTSITTPRGKGRAAAPQQALCIRIRAVAYGYVTADYYIFPGENDTSDFNVGRNRRYAISATISGTNTIDTRTSSVSFFAPNWWEVYSCGEVAEGNAYLSTANTLSDYIFSYKLLEGTGVVTLDGVAQPSEGVIGVLSGSGMIRKSMGYTQRTEGDARMLLSIRDNEGYFLKEQEIKTRFQSTITLSVKSNATSINGQPMSYELTIDKPCYEGGFHVRFDDIGHDCTFTLNGVSAKEFTVPDGSPRTFMIAPPASETVQFGFNCTVGTYPGDPKSQTIYGAGVIQWQSRTITVTLSPSITYAEQQLSQGVYVGTQRSPHIGLWAESSEPVETPLTINGRLRYTEGYCPEISTYQDTPASRTGIVSLSHGAIGAGTRLASYTGYCYGVDPDHTYRRGILLSTGYYLGPMVSFVAQEQVSAELIDASPSQNANGTVRYEYRIGPLIKQ